MYENNLIHMKKTLFVLLLAVVVTYGCTNGTRSSVLSDDALLDTVELYTSRYFTEFIHPNNDLGVLTHTAALSSFPYAPEQAMAAARYWYRRRSLYWGEYGFL